MTNRSEGGPIIDVGQPTIPQERISERFPLPAGAPRVEPVRWPGNPGGAEDPWNIPRKD